MRTLDQKEEEQWSRLKTLTDQLTVLIVNFLNFLN